VFLFQSLIKATDVTAEDCGTIYPKKCFQTIIPYSVVANSDIHSILTHPWSTGLLEKLTVSQLVEKFPTFYGTWVLINAFTRAHHLSLS
jgi:hypothetical protein